jgi:hypothetical protein
MSAILSAFCILFLFWSITHLTRKLICNNGIVETGTQIATIMGAGVCGALAYTWSDTFWFSAVEGEVYAYSSFLTAIVFWLILKWEDHADEPGSDRWLVLIFYLTGLSIGVHLLNLLCLPAIVLVYFYKKKPNANATQSIIALVISAILVALVLYGLVPGIVKIGGWFELFFVNQLGLGFNSGLVCYILVLIGVVLAAIWSTTRSNRLLINGLYLTAVALLGIPFIGNGGASIVVGVVLLVLLFFLLLHLLTHCGTRVHGSRIELTHSLSGACGHRLFLDSSSAADSLQLFLLYMQELQRTESQLWISMQRLSNSTMPALAKLLRQARSSLQWESTQILELRAL